jgi:hypothetical protein
MPPIRFLPAEAETPRQRVSSAEPDMWRRAMKSTDFNVARAGASTECAVVPASNGQ